MIKANKDLKEKKARKVIKDFRGLKVKLDLQVLQVSKVLKEIRVSKVHKVRRGQLARMELLQNLALKKVICTSHILNLNRRCLHGQ
ncbi:hypothetical protein [Faecalicoccus pleomorphus]|uniref:hypothetical protein n=1 Tax=Faecalicoccus pleomorphus TaxID=1323 RepID=UPI001F1161FE|nr:hypothetical protein [Faecalicoccus pleomorphus]